MYAEHFDRVLGYSLRRTDRGEDAADVTAETFLIAWRRLDDVPEEPETKLWLYATARRVLANHRRGDQRRTALGERLRADLAVCAPDHAGGVVVEQSLRVALATLSDQDREVLELAAWEGLQPREIADALGIGPIAARSRLSRARRRLRSITGNDPAPPGHSPSNRTELATKEESR